MAQQELAPQPKSYPVLIIGGSLVGLSAAVCLSWRGVSTVVVERHVGSSPHPRAIGYTPRTMEIFQPMGITDSIPQVPPGFRLRRARVESLAGKWLEESKWTPSDKGEKPKEEEPEQRKLEEGKPDAGYSPYSGAAVAQDVIEPIIRTKAVELGADIRQGTEFVSFEQDAAGVTALVRERDSGKECGIRAQYMIAADGGRSSIREALGISRKGCGYIKTVRSVLFRAPLDEYLNSGVSQFEIEQPDMKAFLTTYQDGRWVLMFTDEIERDESTLVEAIRQAIGRTDVDVQIITTGVWELAGLIADHYDSGRVFLAGDAAHALPPTRGGFGANTGIHDVHNLAWKLEAVLSGRSSSRLLDTYNAERQPVGWLRHQQTFARPDYAAMSRGIAEGEKILDEAAIEFGQLYRSSAVIGIREDLQPAMKPDEWAGQPGTRAPHAWITRSSQQISTLDLFQKVWVLLAEDVRWKTAAASAQEQLDIEVECVLVGTDVNFSDEKTFREAFGVSVTGASLVRPDGYVAWRSFDLPKDPSEAFTEALALASCAVRSATTST